MQISLTNCIINYKSTLLLSNPKLLLEKKHVRATLRSLPKTPLLGHIKQGVFFVVFEFY